MTVRDLFKAVAEEFALAIEGTGALIVTYGAAEALYGCVEVILRRGIRPGERKQVWLSFGMWLLLGLEFQLAADVVRTAVSPTWEDIGQLAAIAAIRTLLNFFLERDLESSGEKAARESPAAA